MASITITVPDSKAAEFWLGFTQMVDWDMLEIDEPETPAEKMAYVHGELVAYGKARYRKGKGNLRPPAEIDDGVIT